MERKKTLEHQWLEMMYRRGGLDEEGRRSLKVLERGYRGECEFDGFVAEYGAGGWRVYRDIWIDCEGQTQIDTMIVTDKGLYVCDVKNYSGEYTYADGKWYVGGRKIIKDIFVQLKRSMEKVSLMQRRIGGRFIAEGFIIFINEHFSLELGSGAEAPVVNRNKLKKFLMDIERDSRLGDVDVDRLCEQIDRFIIDCPYQPPVCDEGRFERLRKGVRCCRCGSYGLEVGRVFVRCVNCRMKEGKEKSVLRTICEYGVIRHERELKLQELYEFMGGEVEKRYLKTILSKYFKLLTTGKHARYKNSKEHFQYAFGSIEFYYKDVADR